VYPGGGHGGGLAGDGSVVSGHVRTASSATAAVARPGPRRCEGSDGGSGGVHGMEGIKVELVVEVNW